MRVEVRCFGGLTDRVGDSRVEVDVDEDATVADLRDALATAHPSIASLLPSVKVAVDLEVAGDDQALAGAHEIALLPPVAGGSDDQPPRVVTGLSAPPIDVDGTIAKVTSPDAGAAAVFLGTVRDHAHDLDDVVRLDYSAYQEMAEHVLARIARELLGDHPAVRGIALVHAIGDLEVGDHTVLVVCTSAHRAEAFDACRDALERVKDRVPVWKREVTRDGAHRWVGLDAPDPAGGAQ